MTVQNFSPYNLLYPPRCLFNVFLKIVEAEFLDSKLHVSYLSLYNKYKHQIKCVLKYITNATRW